MPEPALPKPFFHRECKSRGRPASAAMTENEFHRFQALFAQTLGLAFTPEKRDLLTLRLAPRLAALGLGDYTAYHARIAPPEAREERLRAFDLVTTHETWFFREIRHFDYLREQASEWPLDRPLRVWDAACSSGEEAYSIAMTLAEVMGTRHKRWELLASDISHSCLQAARDGTYPLGRGKDIPQRHLERFCLKGVHSQEGRFCIRRELRDTVHFQLINLVDPLPSFPPSDMVFLRNTLIYMNPAVRTSVVTALTSRLDSGGILFISHTESLQGLGLKFRLLQPGIYRRDG